MSQDRSQKANNAARDSWKPSPELIDEVIKLAWHDRTSFDAIRQSHGLSESQVIKLMRANLKPSSFRTWRQRVSGRVTKHRKLLKKQLNPDRHLPSEDF